MKHLKLETLAHGCMVALALASTANIGKWLDSTGENAVTAWCVAFAVGAMVVTLAITLSRVDRKHNPSMFYMMLIAVVAMCTLSGTLQTFAYDLHMDLWKAALLGYLLPLAGEALVGVAMSMYASYQREELLHNADAATDERISLQLAEVMTNLDLSTSREYIEKRVSTLARRKIDATVDRLMVQQGTQGTQSTPALTVEDEQPNSAESPKLSTVPPKPTPTIEQANAAKQNQIEQRRMKFLSILKSEGDLGTGEFAQRLDVSANTVRSDRKALEARGLLHVNGTVQALG